MFQRLYRSGMLLSILQVTTIMCECVHLWFFGDSLDLLCLSGRQSKNSCLDTSTLINPALYVFLLLFLCFFRPRTTFQVLNKLLLLCEVGIDTIYQLLVPDDVLTGFPLVLFESLGSRVELHILLSKPIIFIFILRTLALSITFLVVDCQTQGLIPLPCGLERIRLALHGLTCLRRHFPLKG